MQACFGGKSENFGRLYGQGLFQVRWMTSAMTEVRGAAIGAARWLGSLLLLLAGTSTVLFFLLHLAGDPAVVIAGSEATPEQLQAVRVEYGFDRSLPVQYFHHMASVARLEFGVSLADGRPALRTVANAFPASLLLGGLAMTLTLLVAIPTGIWLGAREQGSARRVVRGVLFCLQGTPGFVVALLLVQLFAVQLVWLPALGRGGPSTWILPTISTAAFMVPTLARLIEANTQVAAAAPYVLTARARGAGERLILWREIAPNALLGALGFIGAQCAFLVTGLVVLETIFAWPGIGWLLVQSTINLDFPVVQTTVLLIVLVISLINGGVGLLQRRLDPRIGGRHG